MQQTPYFTTLPNRGLVKISGPDARAFLQGLISNDINLLDKQPCVYACLLNAQGKFLHDFFITEKDNVIFLECEDGARAADLARRLSIYKLRTIVTIECEKNIPVYAIWTPSPQRGEGRGEGGDKLAEPHYFALSQTTPPSPNPLPVGERAFNPDPRHPEMGFRGFEKPSGLEEKPFEFYDRHRILLTIPDGSRDMIPEQSTLLECGVDKLNGVSFEKGCYIGQELTARMHYRNLGKKHLRTVKLDALPEDAELRSSCGDVGLAIVKD